jgi:hypothetical protein
MPDAEYWIPEDVSRKSRVQSSIQEFALVGNIFKDVFIVGSGLP